MEAAAQVLWEAQVAVVLVVLAELELHHPSLAHQLTMPAAVVVLVLTLVLLAEPVV